MKFYEERIKDLKDYLVRVVAAVTLFDDDGIALRFINWYPGQTPTFPGQAPSMTIEDFNSIRDEGHVERIIAMTPFGGKTPLGENLVKHVLEDSSLGIMRNVASGTLQKPVLIITITDGQPDKGERAKPDDAEVLLKAIQNTSEALSRQPRYGQGAISFQFAQVGNDAEATRFLASLDNDSSVGRLVDCTSSKSI